jgi:hypothetical protein
LAAASISLSPFRDDRAPRYQHQETALIIAQQAAEEFLVRSGNIRLGNLGANASGDFNDHLRVGVVAAQQVVLLSPPELEDVGFEVGDLVGVENRFHALRRIAERPLATVDDDAGLECAVGIFGAKVLA